MDNATTNIMTSLASTDAVVDVNRSLELLKLINRFNLKYLLPGIILFGIVGNLLALSVFIFSPLRRMTVSVYLAALSLTDIIFLVFHGIGWLETMQTNIFRLDGLCQTMVYMTFVVSFLSLWLIVIFTAELYSSIYCPSLYRHISRPRRAMFITASLTAFACVIYIFTFWLTRQVKQSENRMTCAFSGSKSAAIAVPVMDAVLTLTIPFSLLIFMYVRIVYTLVSITNKRLKREMHTLQQESKESTPSDNILARVIRMGTRRIRKTIYRNKSLEKQSNNVQNYNNNIGNSRMPPIDSIESDNKKKESVPPTPSMTTENEHHNRRHIRLQKVRRISVNLSDGNEITINNSSGDLLSITKLVVKKENLGITIAPRPQKPPHNIGIFDYGRVGERKRNSCTGTDAQSVLNTRHAMRRRSESRPRPMMKFDIPTQYRRRTLIGIDTSAAHALSLDYSGSDPSPKEISINYPKAEIISIDCLEATEEEPAKKDGTLSSPDAFGKNSDDFEDENDQDGTQDKEAIGRLISLQKLKRSTLKMMISIAVIFLVLNLPCHAIRLQSMLRSIFDPEYTASELEFHLQQFFQTVYCFNFVANFLIYGACAKSFRTAFIHLPWHAANTFSQLFHSIRGMCVTEERFSYWAKQRQMRDINEHSRLVEICIPDLRLSQLPSLGPDYRYVSPPCLLRLETSPKESECEKESSLA